MLAATGASIVLLSATTSIAETLNGTREKSDEGLKFEQTMPQIQGILQTFYMRHKSANLEQSKKITLDLLGRIEKVLTDNGIPLPEGPQPQSRIMRLFRRHGYIFTPSPIAIGNGLYLINASLYKAGHIESFDLSQIQFPNLPASKTKVPIINVDTTLVPDIRETPYIPGGRMMFDGITIGRSDTNESIVLIFPDNIRKIANKSGLSESTQKQVTILNEVSQVYFSEFIPPEYF